MKKILYITAVTGLLYVSCTSTPPKTELKSEVLDLVITVPTDKALAEHPAGQYTLGNTEFHIDQQRFIINEIEASSFPDDMTMVKTALESTKDFKSLTEEKTLANGSFGAIYETNNAKKFLFYFKKGNRCYRITPIFNNDGKHFEQAIEAIASLK